MKPVSELAISIYPLSELGWELCLKFQWTFDLELTLHISLGWKYNVQTCAAVIWIKLNCLGGISQKLPWDVFLSSADKITPDLTKATVYNQENAKLLKNCICQEMDSHFRSRVTTTHHFETGTERLTACKKWKYEIVFFGFGCSQNILYGHPLTLNSKAQFHREMKQMFANWHLWVRVQFEWHCQNRFSLLWPRSTRVTWKLNHHVLQGFQSQYYQMGVKDITRAEAFTFPQT